MTLDRIQIDPDRMNGQPAIRDLRLTVRRVLELVALYPDRAELKREFPELEDEDIQQALMYAASGLDDQIVDLARYTELVKRITEVDSGKVKMIPKDEMLRTVRKQLS